MARRRDREADVCGGSRLAVALLIADGVPEADLEDIKYVRSPVL